MITYIKKDGVCVLFGGVGFCACPVGFTGNSCQVKSYFRNNFLINLRA